MELKQLRYSTTSRKFRLKNNPAPGLVPRLEAGRPRLLARRAGLVAMGF
jgi:hypothetical protein